MHDNIHAEYGNAGHRFPRTTGEAFGPGETIFVETEFDDDEELSTRDKLFIIFALVVYTLAAIVIGVILWGPK